MSGSVMCLAAVGKKYCICIDKSTLMLLCENKVIGSIMTVYMKLYCIGDGGRTVYSRSPTAEMEFSLICN